MGTYTIEKGIPAPKHRSNSKYPFRSMSVGDSFMVDMDTDKKEDLNKKRNSIYGSARNKRMNGERFSARFVAGGIRVWRVK